MVIQQFNFLLPINVGRLIEDPTKNDEDVNKYIANTKLNPELVLFFFKLSSFHKKWDIAAMFESIMHDMVEKKVIDIKKIERLSNSNSKSAKPILEKPIPNDPILENPISNEPILENPIPNEPILKKPIKKVKYKDVILRHIDIDDGNILGEFVYDLETWENLQFKHT